MHEVLVQPTATFTVILAEVVQDHKLAKHNNQTPPKKGILKGGQGCSEL
jgi:hypothetical protein